MHKFLSADPKRLGRPDVPPCADAVDEELVGGTPEELKGELIEILGKMLCGIVSVTWCAMHRTRALTGISRR
jgi:hypothetical protein